MYLSSMFPCVAVDLPGGEVVAAKKVTIHNPAGGNVIIVLGYKPMALIAEREWRMISPEGNLWSLQDEIMLFGDPFPEMRKESERGPDWFVITDLSTMSASLLTGIVRELVVGVDLAIPVDAALSGKSRCFTWYLKGDLCRAMPVGMGVIKEAIAISKVNK